VYSYSQVERIVPGAVEERNSGQTAINSTNSAPERHSHDYYLLKQNYFVKRKSSVGKPSMDYFVVVFY
jgi:hypothetical protein